ncbi:hypothetical protein CANCADRAFT_95602 [Tortispora caseinolytica NRRL Y-17796]|uniref:Nucleolar pre-ribosomal-associated protein 1 C-terminal domain-containing protein n=1 Tax=Tortispora caseinolytica NRRL Y-17796 TaxID=767744 RepID=A0A1E4TME5_9ASCO|nr:hypothetical protein CANCADRAFT_95602 [Tortispora caseinolytica NRRL Y-17796]
MSDHLADSLISLLRNRSENQVQNVILFIDTGNLSELLDYWTSTSYKSHATQALCLKAFSQFLAYDFSFASVSIQPINAAKSTLAAEIVNKHLGILHKALTSQYYASIYSASMLLHDIATLDSGSLCPSLISSFDFALPSLRSILAPQKSISSVQSTASFKSTTRLAFSSFLLALLSNAASASQTKYLLKNKKLYMQILRYLYLDPPDFVVNTLYTFKTTILLSELHLRSEVSQIFNDWLIAHLLHLYNRTDAYEIEGESLKISDAAHNFLLHLCCSYLPYPHYGWYPPSAIELDPSKKSYPSYNGTLLSVAKSIRFADSEHSIALFVNICRICQDIVAPLMLSTEANAMFSLNPKLSTAWIAQINALIQLVALPIPEESTLKALSLENVSQPPFALTIVESIAPSSITRANLTKGLESPNNLLRYFTLQLIVQILKKLAHVNEWLSTHFPAFHSAAAELTVLVMQRLPLFSVISQSFSKSIASLSTESPPLILIITTTRAMGLYLTLFPLEEELSGTDFSTTLLYMLEKMKSHKLSSFEVILLQDLLHTQSQSLAIDKWYAKLPGSNSLFTVLLRFACQFKAGAAINAAYHNMYGKTVHLLNHLSENSNLFLSRPAFSPQSILAYCCVSTFQGLSMEDRSQFWLLMDQAVMRAEQSPYKYLDQVISLPEIQQMDSSVLESKVSPFLFALVEQLSFFISGHEAIAEPVAKILGCFTLIGELECSVIRLAEQLADTYDIAPFKSLFAALNIWRTGTPKKFPFAKANFFLAPGIISVSEVLQDTDEDAFQVICASSSSHDLKRIIKPKWRLDTIELTAIRYTILRYCIKCKEDYYSSINTLLKSVTSDAFLEVISNEEFWHPLLPLPKDLTRSYSKVLLSMLDLVHAATGKSRHNMDVFITYCDAFLSGLVSIKKHSAIIASLLRLLPNQKLSDYLENNKSKSSEFWALVLSELSARQCSFTESEKQLYLKNFLALDSFSDESLQPLEPFLPEFVNSEVFQWLMTSESIRHYPETYLKLLCMLVPYMEKATVNSLAAESDVWVGYVTRKECKGTILLELCSLLLPIVDSSTMNNLRIFSAELCVSLIRKRRADDFHFTLFTSLAEHVSDEDAFAVLDMILSGSHVSSSLFNVLQLLLIRFPHMKDRIAEFVCINLLTLTKILSESDEITDKEVFISYFDTVDSLKCWNSLSKNDLEAYLTVACERWIANSYVMLSVLKIVCGVEVNYKSVLNLIVNNHLNPLLFNSEDFENGDSLLFAVAAVIHRLFFASSDVWKSNNLHVSLLLLYNGTVGGHDLLLYEVIKHLENVSGQSMLNNVGSVSFNDDSDTHLRNRLSKKINQHTVNILFQESIMENTLRRFMPYSISVSHNSMTFTEYFDFSDSVDAWKSISGIKHACYDLNFLIPAIAVSTQVNDSVYLRILVQKNVIGILLACFSHEDTSISETSARIVLKIIEELREQKSNDAKTILLLLRKSLTLYLDSRDNNEDFPTIIAVFLGYLSKVMFDGSHCMYDMASSYVTGGASGTVTHVPLFHAVMTSPTDFEAKASWYLQVLASGLRCPIDYELCRRNKIYETLMSLDVSPGILEEDNRKLIREIFWTALAVSPIRNDMIQRHGFLAYIEASLTGTERQRFGLRSLKLSDSGDFKNWLGIDPVFLSRLYI